jgi:hypothetical protein
MNLRFILSSLSGWRCPGGPVHQRPQPLSGKCTAAEGEDDVVAIGTAPKDGPEQRGSGQRAATIDQRQSSQLGREPCQRVAATIAGERAVEDLGEMAAA